jgi:hypothetical protein
MEMSAERARAIGKKYLDSLVKVHAVTDPEAVRKQALATEIARQLGGLIEQKQAAQPTGGYTNGSTVSDYRRNF